MKSASDRGGIVGAVKYSTVCMNAVKHTLYFDPNYATTTGTLYPNFQSIEIDDMYADSGSVQLDGYSSQYPLNLTLNNVRIAEAGTVTASNANISEITDPDYPYEITIPSGSGISVSQTSGSNTISQGITDYCQANNVAPTATYSVNPNGSGNFTTIGVAVTALPIGGGTINIAPGTYKEKSKSPNRMFNSSEPERMRPRL